MVQPVILAFACLSLPTFVAVAQPEKPLVRRGVLPAAGPTALRGGVPADGDSALCGHALRAIRGMSRPIPAWAHDPAGDALTDTDVLHYDLDIAIDPAAVTISGRNIITVKSLINGLSTFQIQLDPAFTPAISINGGNVAWARGVGPVIDVTLDRAYSANEQFDLRVDYSGIPPTGNGTGAITFTTQNGQPLVHTLSEPFHANNWWPVKEDNPDKATADLAFTVPATLLVASNGTRLGIDTLPDGRRKHRWRTNYQTTPYLFSFSTTLYTEFTDTWIYPGGSMPLQFMIYQATDSPTNRALWLQVKDMLTAHSARFGTYPFTDEKYGLYQFSFGGGMEHQTMTGQGFFTDPYTSEYICAHELGHQWWGDMITCATWSDIWLNEGFATYSEALWFENHGRPASASFAAQPPGMASLKVHMQARRPSTNSGTIYITPPAIDDNRIFDTNLSYRKPGWMLHMLRHVVGDTAFFNGLAAYRAAYQYSTATSAQFQTVFENATGQDLDGFFTQWLYSPGAPLYSYAWRNVAAAGRNYVEVYLQQTQNAAWPTFAMPIDCVTSSGGPATTTVIQNDARAEHLLFQVATPITTFALDPDNWILTNSNTSPNFGKTSVAFVEGPPKIVDVQPAPGASTALGGPSTVTVTFHRPVNATAGAFTLTRSGAPVPFTFAYSAPTQTATLTLTGTRMPGTYILGVAASITGTTGGLALDGETANPASPASLPTGDGLPGGASTFTFRVPSCSVADIATEGNANPLAGPDGFVTGIDFDVYVQAFFTALRDASNALIADLTDGTGAGSPDGFVTGTDFDKFVQMYFIGC